MAGQLAAKAVTLVWSLQLAAACPDAPNQQAVPHGLTSISPLVAEGSTGPGTDAAVSEAGPPPATWPRTVPAALPAMGVCEQARLSGEALAAFCALQRSAPCHAHSWLCRAFPSPRGAKPSATKKLP